MEHLHLHHALVNAPIKSTNARLSKFINVKEKNATLNGQYLPQS